MLRLRSTPKPEHTDVHDLGSRGLELLQDGVVVLLNVKLLGMGFVFLYRVWIEIVAFGDLQEGLSNIIFVVITIELYRLLIHYLRYHHSGGHALETKELIKRGSSLESLGTQAAGLEAKGDSSGFRRQ